MKYARTCGFAVSVGALGAFLLYTVCFVVILLVNPPFSWEGIEALAAYEARVQTVWKYVGMGCMIAYACAFPVLAVCAGELAGPEKRLPARIAGVFSVAFCGAVALAYFVQLTATRLQLERGHTEGLVQFTQSYSISALNAGNMLGWTVFYPLATLALALLFGGTRAGKLTRNFCLLNTALMAVGFVGYLCDHFLTLLLTMNLGLGFAGIGMLAGMAAFFRKGKSLL